MDSFNGYPATYPGIYYNPQQQLYGQKPMPQPQYQPIMYNQTGNQSVKQTGGMQWVQGEAGARAFMDLAPGVPTPLWDSESSTIYIKTIDETGRPSMTILDYTERTAPVQQDDTPQVEYATKEQVDILAKQIEDLNSQLSQFENKSNRSQQNNSNRRGNK